MDLLYCYLLVPILLQKVANESKVLSLKLGWSSSVVSSKRSDIIMAVTHTIKPLLELVSTESTLL